MANEEIVRYLREGIDKGFSIDLLRKHLLEGGFLEKDIIDALNSVNKDEMSENGKIGIKWMKVAGIIGIISLLLGIFYNVALFIPPLGNLLKSLFNNSFFVIPLFIFLMILSLFYYSGFVRFGRRVDSKLVSFCAWSMIIFIFAFIMFYITSVSIIYSFSKDFIQQTSPLGKAVPSSGNSTLSQGLGLSLLIVMAALFIFYFIVQVLFSIGLIKAGKKVKFSRASGILDIIYIVLSIVGIVTTLAIIIFNPLLIAEIFVDILLFGKISPIIIAAIIVGIVLYFMKLLAVLFASLALFDASKKFE